MSRIERIASNAPWEPIFGYSRVVKAGEWLLVSGTTATDERGLLVGAGQMYVQTRQALLNIKTHLERAGLGMGNIVRTRVFTTDISRFHEIARAHKEIFADAPPASSLLEVCRLIHPDMLVEIEADAWSGAAQSSAARGAEAPSRQTRSKRSSGSKSKSTRPKPR